MTRRGTPPNYGPADYSGESCGTCANFDASLGFCTACDAAVDSGATCDAWTQLADEGWAQMSAPRGFELRTASDGSLSLTGVASKTEAWYSMGSYRERIAAGSFKRTLGEKPDVVLLVNHAGTPLARTSSGTMRLSEDQRGLIVEASLDARDPDVKAVEGKMRRGDLKELSFAFEATAQEWNSDHTQRVIKGVNLHRGDVSLVSMAANPSSTATLRQGVTLEMRRAAAERIGQRVLGNGVLWRAEQTCARCRGTGTIELNCPNCRAGSDGEARPPIMSTTTGGGSALAAAKHDLAVMRAGVPYPADLLADDALTRARAEVAEWRGRAAKSGWER
jgi:HK97 family phage prohead protease